jgi:uncharacterized membrane protein (DUF106 family)
LLNIDFTSAIEHITKEGYDFLLPNTMEKCKTRLSELQKEIRKVTKEATTHRRNEMNQQIQQRRDENNNKLIVEFRCDPDSEMTT